MCFVLGFLLMQQYLALFIFYFFITFHVTGVSSAAEFSASFKNTDIESFINTVGENLNKTIIIEPSVRGKINVRSYDLLNEEQYYQFFLNVLDVYGFAVVAMESGTIKVVGTKDAQMSAIPIADSLKPGIGDEMVTRLVPIFNLSASELAPLLRSFSDNTLHSHITHFEPSNMLMLTGSAAAVNRLVNVVSRVDHINSKDVDIIKLKFATAAEVVRLLTDLNIFDNSQGDTAILSHSPNVIADERTNSVVVCGEPEVRLRTIMMVRRLDQGIQGTRNTRVIYLKYGRSKELVHVLKGISASIEANKIGRLANIGSGKLTISSDETTNSLVITAHPDVMAELEMVITKLDIPRSQVLLEAIIVEMQDGKGLRLGVQWSNANSDGSQITNTGQQTRSVTVPPHNGFVSSNFGYDLSGMIAGIYRGDWATLATALASNTKSDILSTPRLVTMDNQEATFNVGQEVPVQSGSQSTASSDEVFNTIERKTVGTKLVVTPQINEGDSVLLNLVQEVSSVAQTQASGTADLGPTFDTRTVKNSVLVKSGETVVVGGLMDEKTVEQTSKVPLLGDIPVLGYLFRSSSNTTTKRNLMLFIRPTILRDSDVYNDISNSKYNIFRAKQIANSSGNSITPARYVLPSYSETRSLEEH